MKSTLKGFGRAISAAPREDIKARPAVMQQGEQEQDRRNAVKARFTERAKRVVISAQEEAARQRATISQAPAARPGERE